MMRSKSQHIPVNLSRRHQTALDPQLPSNDRHVGDLEIVGGNSERVDGSSRSHDGKELRPVGLEGCGDEEMIDWAGDGKFFGALCGDKFGGAKGEGFSFLGVGGGEDSDDAAFLGSELDGQVTEASDADDTDTLSWCCSSIEGLESILFQC